MDKIINKDHQEAHKVFLLLTKVDTVTVVSVVVKAVVMVVANLAKIQENVQLIKEHPVNNKMEKSHSKSDGELAMTPYFIDFLYLQNGLERSLVKVVL